MAVSEGALFCGPCHRITHDIHKMAAEVQASM